MELQGSAYLYTVATLGMTYVAFTLIFIFLRQTRGGFLTKFELLTARNFIKVSFISITGALLPPLGALLNLPETMNWRLSSFITAALVIEHAVTFPRLRRAVTGVGMPPGIVVAVGTMWVAGVVLLANVAWSPVHLRTGLFALGVTLPLFVTMWAMVRRVETFIQAPDAKDLDPTKG